MMVMMMMMASLGKLRDNSDIISYEGSTVLVWSYRYSSDTVGLHLPLLFSSPDSSPSQSLILIPSLPLPDSLSLGNHSLTAFPVAWSMSQQSANHTQFALPFHWPIISGTFTE